MSSGGWGVGLRESISPNPAIVIGGVEYNIHNIHKLHYSICIYTYSLRPDRGVPREVGLRIWANTQSLPYHVTL